MDDSLSRRAFLGVLSAGSLAPTLAAAQTFAPDRVPVVSRELWEWLRAQLVLHPGCAWLDTARFGPTLRAIVAEQYRRMERQSLDFPRYQAATFGPESIREPLAAIGDFIGADPGDLVLTPGAAAGLAMVAQGLDLQPGDEVLTTTHDHPAAVYPWLVEAKRRGIKVVQLPQDGTPVAPAAIVGRIAAAITPRTRVLAFAHVQYTDGCVMPVRELCTLARGNGIFTVVDGAQAPGLVDLAVRSLGCDAYATCFHKWLNGPPGTGALFLSPGAQQKLWPAAADGPAGWDANDRYGQPLPPPGDVPYPAAQAKFGQLARYDGPAFDALPIAFELQRTVSPARIATRVRELSAYLRLQVAQLPQLAILSPAHPSLASGIVSLRVAGADHGALVSGLEREDDIVVGHVRHGATFDAVRVSLDAGASIADIDRLLLAVQRRL